MTGSAVRQQHDSNAAAAVTEVVASAAMTDSRNARTESAAAPVVASTASHPYTVSPPKAIGLYDPAFERDACGVGLIANVKSVQSHELVRDALQILERLSHRGACGCDPNSGDGAGILLGLPDSFFRRTLKQTLGVELPATGKYAVGLVFLSKAWDERQKVKVWIESVVAEHGARVICWRPVPTDNSMLGPGSKDNEPHMEHLFVTADQSSFNNNSTHSPIGGQAIDEKALTALLYVIRKKLAHGSQRHGPPPGRVYVCSLSPRTIVYKGQLSSEQLSPYFLDLNQQDFTSHLGLVHSRFSTNTFPSWERAQPLRNVAHNGEINTLKGNSNWMRSRSSNLAAVGDDAAASILSANLQHIGSIVEPNVSDSGAMDNCVELLTASGRPIEEAMCMMIPESWQNHGSMDPQRRAMYEYFSHKMEPWDGPALVAFTDGHKIGATLDRNGLRPGRVIVTTDDRVILSSEVGVLPSLPDASVLYKSRLIPGEIFLIDFDQQRIVSDVEIKRKLASRLPYAQWLAAHKIELSAVVAAQERAAVNNNSSNSNPLARRGEHIRNDIDDTRIDVPTGVTTELERLKAFGYSHEVVSMIVGPMGTEAMEMLGSMGNDQALTFLSTKPRHIYDYFQQMFAQVTNPPIDPIRESIVMTLTCPLGPEKNLLDSQPQDCARVSLTHPVLRPAEFYALTHLPQSQWQPKYIDMTFAVDEVNADNEAAFTSAPASATAAAAVRVSALKLAIQRICAEALAATASRRVPLLVLTDRRVDSTRLPVPSLLAVGAVHQTLVAAGLRTQVGIVVESGDACEVHHMCLLTGFGADAIYPWVAYTAIRKFQADNDGTTKQTNLNFTKLVNNYAKAAEKGILKVMAKMGISTLASYKGAQIFEAVGVAAEVMDICFTGCPSRIGGVSFDVFATDLLHFHNEAFLSVSMQNTLIQSQLLRNNGDYHWRSGQRGEAHMNHPDAISKLQEAARYNSRKAFAQYSDISNALATKCTLRGQFELRTDMTPIPVAEVESVASIVKRFASGAMSYGSISIEAHSTLAIAMNQIGARSNTGEGGEHLSRYDNLPTGESARSAIKQVASGRFGVTIHYLTNSDEIQIKMAQGAKPGEGGELPGYKVVGEIAKTRMTTAGVGLISPPPHHDIYSIEDLAQLIYDLKNANPTARISVKLVSEAGVGVVAAGVAKGKADHILISGHDGGTGASKWTGIKHAGLPWELGLAETHQTLVLNGLRSRVVLQTDGQLKTGLDVVKAALLGAEEFCFATAPLIALGCIMMRKCHLNTCPVGIATQDPELRAMFTGTPEHVVNFFWMIAEEARDIMASLGVRKFTDLVGRVELMVPSKSMSSKAMQLDLSCILVGAKQLNPLKPETYCTQQQVLEVPLEQVLDSTIMAKLTPALINSGTTRVRANFRIHNTDRTVGTLLSHYVTKAHGVLGLPDNTIHLRFRGSAGQSFGAWLAAGITVELNGDANDYVGKGLSGGTVLIYPPKDSTFLAEDNVIAGNVCFYGATGGSAFLRGRALQRFAVRNSGAAVVVEGIGDHGCEYMTGGTIVVLGPTGRNFAAGMSGGVAYVYDPQQRFPANCNRGLVQLEKLVEQEDLAELESLLELHRTYTGSAIADKLLWTWPASAQQFVKVIPTEYKQAIIAIKAKEKQLLLQQQKKQQQQGGVAAAGQVATNATASTQRHSNNQSEVLLMADNEAWAADSQWYGAANKVNQQQQQQHLNFQPEERSFLPASSMITVNETAATVAAPAAVSSCGSGCSSSKSAGPVEVVLAPRQRAKQQQQLHLQLENESAPSQLHMNRTSAAVAVAPVGTDIEELRAATPSPTRSPSSPRSSHKHKHSPVLAAAPVSQLVMHSTAATTAPLSDRPISVAAPLKKRGFIEYERSAAAYRAAAARVEDFDEIYAARDEQQLATQAARCMDCGVPFCHDSESHGCPLGNKIPEWNELVYQGKWKTALERLLDTNNFPEFTGRICPAPCEGSCVLGIIAQPVTIKSIEVAIIDHAWEQGWMVPKVPTTRTGKTIAIIGSGPAGLAAADQLNKVGHTVTVYEQSDRVGGLLMYGVPNMKLDKSTVVDRRVQLMRDEGIRFVCNAHISGDNINPAFTTAVLLASVDAVILAVGATIPRDLPVTGRELSGVHYAMDFLHGSTKSWLDEKMQPHSAAAAPATAAAADSNVYTYQSHPLIDAKGKHVIVIGGGDTGNDCLGTALRQHAASVVNFELLPQPPDSRGAGNPWPQWPRVFRVDYGHEEATLRQGGKDPREYSLLSKRFIGDSETNSRIVGVETVQICWEKSAKGEWVMSEVPNSTKLWQADLVFLAMGFTGPSAAATQPLNIDLDARNNIRADRSNYRTSVARVFAAGDCRRGQSLVVHAIAEGRQAAREVDRYLMKTTFLP